MRDAARSAEGDRQALEAAEHGGAASHGGRAPEPERGEAAQQRRDRGGGR